MSQDKTTGEVAPESSFPAMKTLRDVRQRMSIKRLKDKRNMVFAEAMQKDVDAINDIINQYNASDRLNKPQWLNRLRSKSQAIQDKYPGNVISDVPAFQTEIHQNLYNEIKTHTALLSESVSVLTYSAEETLANMSPFKVSRMLELLSAGKEGLDQLDTLFAPEEEGYDAFQAFRSQYTITALKGNNAKNFKMVRNTDNQISVLKVEYRLDIPKGVERELRGILPDTFTPVYAERQATFVHQDPAIQKTTCSLLITSYCPGDDLETYATKLDDPKTRIRSAMNLYTQMGDILFKMQSAGYAFLDAKNSNWLVDVDGKLQLADTKSFLPVEPDGQLDEMKFSQAGYCILRTRYMTAPEMLRHTPFSADKMHVQMLGRNLYEYLMGGNPNVFYEWEPDLKKAFLRQPGDLEFPSVVFSSVEGQLLQYLIAGTLDDDPAERISLKTAMAELYRIQHLDQLNTIKEHCEVLKILTKPARNEYYESIKPKLSSLINNASDFYELVTVLDYDQGIEVYSIINDDIVNNTGNIQDFCMLLQSMDRKARISASRFMSFSTLIHNQKDFNLFKKAMGSEYVYLIKDEQDFKLAFNYTDPDDLTTLYNEMYSWFPSFLYDLKMLKTVLQLSLPQHQRILIEAMTDSLPHMIQNKSDLRAFIDILGLAGCKALCRAVKLTEIIKNEQDFVDVFSNLSEDKRDILCRTLSMNLLVILSDKPSFERVKSLLPGKFALEMESAYELCFNPKNLQDLAEQLAYAPESLRDTIYTAVREKLPLLIKTEQDFNEIAPYLNEQQCVDLTQLVQHVLAQPTQVTHGPELTHSYKDAIKSIKTSQSEAEEVLAPEGSKPKP